MLLEKATIWQKLQIWLIYLLPHHLITRLVYWLSRLETPLKDPLIRLYIKTLDVNMDEALYSEPENYRSFNEFFTRALKPEAREICDDEAVICSPCDGAILSNGRVEDGDLFQAKGKFYSLEDLCAGSEEAARMFANALYFTIYLSPKDYHRVHMPVDGKLKEMTHVPGRLFNVMRHGAFLVPNLYCRNERLISIFETPVGMVAIIMIGAIGVGSMETKWAGLVTPASLRVSSNMYSDKRKKEVHLRRGEEMGRFNMGSSVICLIANKKAELLPAAYVGETVKVGNAVARTPKTSDENSSS